MPDPMRQRTPPARRLRIVALAALLLLGFHGAALLGHHHEGEADRDCGFCHFGQLCAIGSQPPPGPPIVPASVDLTAVPERSADEAARALPLSRGPPA